LKNWLTSIYQHARLSSGTIFSEKGLIDKIGA
jgi:hypothetical protein